MTNINPNRIKFYQFLNDDISLELFESWVYENKELENLIPEDHYNDLLAFNFKSREIKSILIGRNLKSIEQLNYLKELSLVKLRLFWQVEN